MGLNGLSFLRPWWLLVLLPLALLLWRVWRMPQHGAAVWRQLIDAHLLAHLLDASSPRGRGIGMAVVATALLAAVLALAGPAFMPAGQPVVQRDVTRLLVLDLSPGMAAPLERVKSKLLALLQAWPDGQTALLVYAGEPYLVVPPTTDTQTIALVVPDLAIDVVPVTGNRPERALRMAIDTLQRSATQQRELLWITAGADAAQWSQADLGTVRLSVLQVVVADDRALGDAATRSGGVSVRMTADDSDVRQLVSTLATGNGWVTGIDRVEGAAMDIGYWLMLPLLPLAALAFRRGVLAMVLMPLLLAGLLLPRPVLAQDAPWSALWADYQGWQLLEASLPQAAAVRFADPRWRAVAHYRAGQFAQVASMLSGPTDADTHYNRANALAKQGQFADALAAYDAALTLRSDDADARFNRDLVQRLLNPPPHPPPPAAGGGGASPPAGGGQQAGKPAPTDAGVQSQRADQDAARIAQQWLRAVPDQPGSLLRRKLLAEQRRRQSGEAARAW